MTKQVVSFWDWENNVDDQLLNKIALRFNEETYSYRRISEKTTSLLEQYLDLFEEGEILALWLPNCPDLLCACMAGFRSGIVPMPINPESKTPELIECIHRAECHHLIINESQARKISSEKFHATALRHIWVIGKERLEPYLEFSHEQKASNRKIRCSPSDEKAALILHTSGSSGKAKGVIISLSSLQHIVRGRLDCAEINHNSTSIIASSLSHSVGLYQALAFLSAGAFFELLEDYDIPALVEKINNYKPTHLIMVVAAFEKILASKSISAESFANIEFAAASADRIPDQLQKDYCSLTGLTLAVTYGMTELSWMLINKSGLPAKSTSLGQAAPGVKIRLTGKNNIEVGQGSVGEIVASSPKAMLGYLNKPGSPLNTDPGQETWISSGDLAYQDKDGYYWYAGRIDDMIALATGDLVAPLEVERVITEIAGIIKCVVLGMPTLLEDSDQHHILPWAVVIRDRSNVTKQIINDHLMKKLSDYKLPRKIIFLEEMPEGVSGKISRKVLRQWLLNLEQ